MVIRWRPSQVGIRIQGCIWTVSESAGDWGSGLGTLAVSAGVGIIGDTTGTATEAAASFTTTTGTFRIAGLSSIATVFRDERISIQGEEMLADRPNFMVAALKAVTSRTPGAARIREHSAGSITAGPPENIPPVGNPASVDFMEEAASTAAAVTVEAVAEDSSDEVMKP